MLFGLFDLGRRRTSRMRCGPERGGRTVCEAGGRRFVLHSGKSAKRGKAARGKWLQRHFRCKRGAKGRFVSCRPR